MLPNSCVEEEGPRYVHGGSRWNCGSAVVEAVWGMWGLAAADEGLQQCRTTKDGVPAVVSHGESAGTRRVQAWYLTGTVHEPTIYVTSRVTDDAFLEAIALSGSWIGERGPNR